MKIKKPNNKIRRLTLKGWAAIGDLSKNIQSTTNNKDWNRVSELIFQVIEIGSNKVDKNLAWMDVVKIYNQIFELNRPTKDFPILTSKSKGKPLPWEYDGRGWYFWLNLFAENYGWSEEQVSNLDIDSAIGLYQEIIINEQLRNEWEWGLSEISYEYNKSTKKSHFKPLPRPDWMRPMVSAAEPVKKTKFPVSMIPAGLVVNLDEETEPPKNTPA
jgi:hypothetical protein